MLPLRQILLLLMFFCLLLPVTAEQIAFPGAEGFGRFATGGRGGDVIAVTNLNDSGPGSLRAAIEAEGPRTIVFRVSGTIFLESDLDIKNGDVTIAGQSAPGEGITLANYTLSVEANNVIIRFIRSRLGDRHSQEADAFEARFVRNIIIDHCSFSWAVDEVASAYLNQNFTMQWCVISEALHNSVHAKGNHGFGGIWGGRSSTFHHNLLAHCRSRMPRFSGARYEDYGEWGDDRVDHRYNVIYNWSTNSAYGAEPHENGFKPQYNIIGNTYKAGPATIGSNKDRIVEPTLNGTTKEPSQFYVWGNYVFGYPEVSRNNREGVDFAPSEYHYRQQWELLRFNRDSDGDGALDIFESYDGIEIDPEFGVDELPRFDLTAPDILMQAYREHRVAQFENLPADVQDKISTWFGYYKEAGAVMADGTPYEPIYGRVDPESELADQLRGEPSVILDDILADEPFPAGGYREDWALLRFNRDADGDDELDIFEDYTGVDIDPAFGVDRLPRLDVSSPEILVDALHRNRAARFEDLPSDEQEMIRNWFGYYEEAGAVMADGTPYEPMYERIDPDSELSRNLRFIHGRHAYFPALEAYEQVLAHAGASFPHRDSVDARVIDEVRNGTFTFGNLGHIDSQTEVGGYPDLNSATAPVDTDGDGMPDEWELARGLDPEDPEDRNGDANGNGYTNLEDYLNGLVADHFTSAYSADYLDWADAAFWDDDSRRGLHDDPDEDGRPNALEYAFASDPLRKDIQETFGAKLVPLRSYEFYYRRGADLRFQVLSSTDLTKWSVMWDSADPPSDSPDGIHTAPQHLDFAPESEGTDPGALFWTFAVEEENN